MSLFAALLMAATATAMPYYPSYPVTQQTCQKQLLNTDFGISFNAVPIWKEPWVTGECLAPQGGNCRFVDAGVPAETTTVPTDLSFTAGGFIADQGALARVGQSFTLCPRVHGHDYKLKFRSALVGAQVGDEAPVNEVSFIFGIGDDVQRLGPIDLTKDAFGEAILDLPGSASGGDGFIFFTAESDQGYAILVDEMSLL